jgi:hypothetical protein
MLGGYHKINKEFTGYCINDKEEHILNTDPHFSVKMV